MDIVLENRCFRLSIGEDAIPRSLICKETGEECLQPGEKMPIFTVTQNRPFINEIKLAYPNKRTTFEANRLRMEGNRLIAGFELAPYEAVVEVSVEPRYIAFRLVEFISVDRYSRLSMEAPPVCQFRVLQVPIRDRKFFGEWLNVSWDEKAAVNVIGTSPYTKIDAERREGFRILYADLMKDEKLSGIGAALLAAPGDRLLDGIDDLEKDFDLPRGVQNRRNPEINRSIYWTFEINPGNVDMHVKYAKMGGFTKMLIYYTSFLERYGDNYDSCGDYENYLPEYPEGEKSLREMLEKIQNAGIDPGFHFLHTFIGVKSRYVTPVADHRLNIIKQFTLSKAYHNGDTELYVEQNPEGVVLHEHIRQPGYDCKVLQFGGELFHYTGYTVDPPYMFTGVTGGHYDTLPQTHPRGQVGGLLDVTEFGADVIYIDQKTSLQDEIADKLAKIYRLGFKFVYFDGSEGTNAPHEIHVPGAQYRVYKRLEPAPLFTEGAAKAHFSWHFLSGGNAFDLFRPHAFKEMIRRYPAEEAPRMRQDFTRLNFGWWGFWEPGSLKPTEELDDIQTTKDAAGTQADMVEYGTSRAAGWDCPITIQFRLQPLNAHPRTADCLEVLRRWEDVRKKNWLTPEQKQELRNVDQEHTLLINEEGEYELVPYDSITEGTLLSAYVFERRGSRYVVYWHQSGSGTLCLPVGTDQIEVYDQLGGEMLCLNESDGKASLPVDHKRYLRTELSKEQIVEAFRNAVIVEETEEGK